MRSPKVPGWVGFVDLPFSLAADAAVLPYTLLRELWRPAPDSSPEPRRKE